ncbi:hypothetical protein KSP40_PGU005122 [Platanthera guangdongensis]|uniref:Uncharacterized protein n=1 Tax=Platanthera guangdongensis TaxID=2320717 RepID=A0ABR2MB09_9ASPA
MGKPEYVLEMCRVLQITVEEALLRLKNQGILQVEFINIDYLTLFLNAYIPEEKSEEESSSSSDEFEEVLHFLELSALLIDWIKMTLDSNPVSFSYSPSFSSYCFE